MKKAKYTTGRWICYDMGNGMRIAPEEIKDCLIPPVAGMLMQIAICKCPEPWSDAAWENQKANAHRIVDCVNACEGIEDPSVVKLLLQICRMAQNRDMNDMKRIAMNVLADDALAIAEGRK